MKISVVIPVLNERSSLPATIAALRACHGLSEIIVADGGSTDGTVEWLQAQPDIVLVRSMRGKGPQLNVGAAVAFHISGAADICLLFLHADCVISQPAIDALHAALADPQLAG